MSGCTNISSVHSDSIRPYRDVQCHLGIYNILQFLSGSRFHALFFGNSFFRSMFYPSASFKKHLDITLQISSKSKSVPITNMYTAKQSNLSSTKARLFQAKRVKALALVSFSTVSTQCPFATIYMMQLFFGPSAHDFKP